MASVTFPPSVGGDGSTVTDDSNPTTGLANGGHRTRFVPALAQVVAVAGNTVTKATEAAASAAASAASAATALNAPGTQATSVTGLLIGLGNKSLTLDQTGKAFGIGQYVQIVNNMTPTQWMVGAITAFNSGTGAMTVNVTSFNGSGTISTWKISPATPLSGTPTFTYLTVSNGSITGGAPATSGSATDPNSMSRFQAGSVVLDFGAYANGDGWLQQRSGANYATNYGLVLNPNGGLVSTGGLLADVYGNVRTIPAVGTKTGSYTLVKADVGRYVQLGTGGAITIPTGIFAEGDVVSLFNNTTGNVTITCSALTAYKGGTNSAVTSLTLQTRGLATVFFITGALCVVTGNLA